MKLKLIFIVMLVFLIVGIASAGETVKYSNETKNITFEGVNFTIPQGYGESKDIEDFNDLGSEGQTCFYVNEANGEIIITVISDWMGMNLNELKKDGAVKSEINGHTGWNYTDSGLHCFGYIDDDKGIVVAVTNETRLSQVII